jgi:hypothetical protein
LRIGAGDFFANRVGGVLQVGLEDEPDMMFALPPAFTFAVIWSMPAMPLRAFSIGMMTA